MGRSEQTTAAVLRESVALQKNKRKSTTSYRVPVRTSHRCAKLCCLGCFLCEGGVYLYAVCAIGALVAANQCLTVSQ